MIPANFKSGFLYPIVNTIPPPILKNKKIFKIIFLPMAIKK